VDFSDDRDAQDCIHELDGTRFMGERIIVEEAKGRERKRSPRRDRRPPGDRLVVANLPSGISWQDLKDLFRKVGDVQYADVRDGRGVVEMADASLNDEAVKEFGLVTD
jgi:arginine/serine-rich splicing factor 4/5/6